MLVHLTDVHTCFLKKIWYSLFLAIHSMLCQKFFKINLNTKKMLRKTSHNYRFSNTKILLKHIDSILYQINVTRLRQKCPLGFGETNIQHGWSVSVTITLNQLFVQFSRHFHICSVVISEARPRLRLF